MHPMVSACFSVFALLAVALSPVLGSSSILEGGSQQRPQNYPTLVPSTLPPAIAVPPKLTKEELRMAIEPPLGNNVVPLPHPEIPRTPGIYPAKQVDPSGPKTPPLNNPNAPLPNPAVAREAPMVYPPKPETWQESNLPPQTNQMTASHNPVIPNSKPQDYPPKATSPELTNKLSPNIPLKPPFPFNQPSIYPPSIPSSKKAGLPPILTITPPNPVAPEFYPPKPEAWKGPTLLPQSSQKTTPPKPVYTRPQNYPSNAMPPELTDKRPPNNPLKSPFPFNEPPIYPPRILTSKQAGLPPTPRLAPPKSKSMHVQFGRLENSFSPPTASPSPMKFVYSKSKPFSPGQFPVKLNFISPPPHNHNPRAAKWPGNQSPKSGKFTTTWNLKPLP